MRTRVRVRARACVCVIYGCGIGSLQVSSNFAIMEERVTDHRIP
jgi:hypothetical protein